MKGDFTRFTFKPQKHYTSVLMQQGRVQLDADWNEQANIHAYFNQSIAQDMIGNSGAAKNGGGFEIQPINNSTDLLITPGHIYVDGILCQLEGSFFKATKINQNQFQVKSLYIDNRILEKGQWLEIEFIDKKNNNQLSKKQLQIQEIDDKKKLLTFTKTEDIDGEIKKLRRLTTYNNQPDYSQEIQIDQTLVEGKKYLAYLDVWQRHISAIEDKDIREIALQGSDTATRTKTVWQVKLLELENNISKHNFHTSENWEALTKKRDIYLNVNDENFSVGKEGGQNQLYRIEIHKPGKLGEATFKWSRNNGAIVFPIKEIKSDYIEISNFGRDISDSFKDGQWVEITNDIRELQGEPGTLVQLKEKISRNKIFFNPATIVNNSSDSAPFPQGHNLKVRIWDSNRDKNQATITLQSSNEVALENGIQLKLAGNSFKTGDYWLIPTRAAKVNKHHIQWNFDNLDNPIPQPPDGIEHHYSPLALLYWEEEEDKKLILKVKQDLRKIFPSLSNCLDKTGDTMTGALEIQDNLYITGKPNQDIPGKVGIGTKKPKQRLVILDIDNHKARVGIGYNDTEQTAALAIKDNVGIGTVTPQQTLVIHDKGKVAIGYNKTEQSAALAIKDNVGIGYYKIPDTTALAIEGKVGINTILPKSDLSVLGKVAIGSTNYTEVANAPDNGLIVEGNVGIGTPNPTAAKLEVNGDIKIAGDSIKNANNFRIIDTQNQNWLNINPDAEYPGIALYNSVAISKGGLAIGELNHIEEGSLKVSKSAFLATTSGKVGIGTQQIHNNTLLGIAGSTTIGLSYVGDHAAPENGLLVEGKVNISGIPENQPAKNAQLYTQGDAYINGEVYATDINITGSRIKSADFLGIIETNAKDWLRVNPDLDYSGIALYNPVAISNGGLAILGDEELTTLPKGELKVSKSAFLATTSGKVGIGTQQIHNNTLLGIAGSTTIGFSYVGDRAAPENGLLVEGKVNIGDTVPRNNEARDSQLYVKGNAYIDDILLTDTIVFSEAMQRSSEQYKDDIVDLSIQESFEILENLKPVKYSYKTDETKKIHAGFIAEQSPDLFTSPDKKMLDSTGIIAILTNVLKEHIHTNSALSHVIANQQKEIANLRERIRKLEENNQKFFW